MRFEGLRVALAHEVAEPLGVELLSGLEGSRRAAANTAQDVGQLFPNDLLAHQFVGQLEVVQEVVVEEVPEGAVSHVMQEAGHPQQLLEECRRGAVGEDGPQRWVELLGQAPGQVHGPQRMLEAAVLGGGKHPAGGLKLRDPAQTLHPRACPARPARWLLRGCLPGG